MILGSTQVVHGSCLSILCGFRKDLESKRVEA